MARRRFLVDAVRGGAAELRGEEARHLSRVLRAEAGQRYEIADASGAYLAEIEECSGDRVVFRVLEPVATPGAPLRIALCAALIKFDRFEWMVEKATELGVETIRPFEAARSSKGLLEGSRKRAERWQRIARESSQQARRARAPSIEAAVPFEACLASAEPYRFFLEENEAPPLLREIPASREPDASAALLVGPEGGWTDRERSLAAAAGWCPVSLGPGVLRAETAALAAVAVLMNGWLR